MLGNQNLGVANLLHRCQQVEAAMAKLYEQLALAHTHDREMATLWLKTAKEEENHGLQFQLALNLRNESVIDLRVEATRVEQVLSNVRAYLDEVRRHPPTVEEALEKTVAMEEAMVDLHMNSVARFDNERHRKLFAAMMASDKAHVESLRSALVRVRARRR